MASAILPSRNEPRSSDFMSKFTNNSNLNFTRLQNITCPNPNPNPSHFFIGNTNGDVLWKNRQQLRSSAPPGAAFTGSSINSAPLNSYGNRYITFRLGSYTRRELNELKKRLVSDLERVRVLRRWICSTPVPKKNYHPPQLELPTAPEVALTEKERQKSAVGQKRTKPSPSLRDTKKQCGRVKNNAQRSKAAMRKCEQILAKLMTHKHGWVFNTPVDAAALKLYDYHSIIKNPMDLGTIKSKLAKNEYESPLAFASDVRLTFQNAMVYNGKGSEVFVMAERFLLLFEDLFNATHQKFVENQAKKQYRSAKVPILVKKTVSNAAVVLEKPVSNVTTSNHVAPRVAVVSSSTTAAAILGKPMARDANQPEMTAISNTKGIMANLGSSVQVENSPASEALVEDEGRKRDAGEEDIDIGEEIPVTNFPCVEIEKDARNVTSGSSSSSSSSGSDSSSSDSGSDSSSGDSSNEQEQEEEEANSTPKGGCMGM